MNFHYRINMIRLLKRIHKIIWLWINIFQSCINNMYRIAWVEDDINTKITMFVSFIFSATNERIGG